MSLGALEIETVDKISGKGAKRQDVFVDTRPKCTVEGQQLSSSQDTRTTQGSGHAPKIQRPPEERPVCSRSHGVHYGNLVCNSGSFFHLVKVILSTMFHTLERMLLHADLPVQPNGNPGLLIKT